MDLSHSPGGFRSRRSYPSLNHVSLAPLTPRFPIDDDDKPQDYFAPRDEEPLSSRSGYETPPRTSYLSSYSVPGTPGVLSYSRSGSSARHHHRSKSSTRDNLSDTNLQAQNVSQPAHHHPPHISKARRSGSRNRPSESSSRHDAEWILRAGIALASSTREQKGQSWLEKRESSTSLVTEPNTLDVNSPVHHGRTSRRSRSGRSTPSVYSRRGSISRTISRRGSRPDLAMTGLEMTPAKSGVTPAEDHRHVVPDFVDERIRAEIKNIQQEEEGYLSTSSDEYFDSDDDMDEQELQRLTRERGFGLGSWVDRVVGWTIFGDDDWPWSHSTGPVDESPRRTETAAEEDVAVDMHSDSASVSDMVDDVEVSSVAGSEQLTAIEKPGEQGGWEDAGWLFRTMKRAFF